jgi:DNA primase
VLPDYEELVPSPYLAYQEWPEWWLDEKMPWSHHMMAKQYVEKRGLDTLTANHFDLRYDEERKMIVCPFRDVNGKLSGARGRHLYDYGLKHYDYAWNGVRNSHLVWFNEQALNRAGPMVIVEGQFDCMRVWAYHRKVMAILSAKTTSYKMAKLTAEDTVVLMLDNDPTGRQKVHEWTQYLGRKGVQCGVIDLPEGVKDAGEAPEEWLKETFENL